MAIGFIITVTVTVRTPEGNTRRTGTLGHTQDTSYTDGVLRTHRYLLHTSDPYSQLFLAHLCTFSVSSALTRFLCFRLRLVVPSADALMLTS